MEFQGCGCHPDMTNVRVKLSNSSLWKQFHEHGTEMIITKLGRRMFPSLRIEVTGLEPDARYFVIIQAVLSSGNRYKFGSQSWNPVGQAEPQSAPFSRIYVHPDSPATGASWMSKDILFHRAKLTNNPLDRSGNVVLTSMHKYIPRIHIVKASDILAVHMSPATSFAFEETEFIAVTAYQNDKITKLKIDNNPFAKGFRESGQAKTKRKSKGDDDSDDSHDHHDQKKFIAQDDSGISVGSVTPPLEETRALPPSPPLSTKSPEPLSSKISGIPLPTLTYPPSFWPYSPYMYHSPLLAAIPLPPLGHLPPPPPPPPMVHPSFSYHPYTSIPAYSPLKSYSEPNFLLDLSRRSVDCSVKPN